MANSKNNNKTKKRGMLNKGSAGTARSNPVARNTNPGRQQVVTLPRSGHIVPRRQGDGLVIRNAEVFATAGTSSGSTTATSLGVVASTPVVATWAAPIVGCYQYYRFRKLRFHYSSQVPTTTAGAVVMGAFFDTEDAFNWLNFGSSTTLSQTAGAVRGPAWASTVTTRNGVVTSDMSLDIDVNLLHLRTPWFIVDPAPGTTALANQSIPLWLGLAVLPSGTLSQALGVIYIDYEIELCRQTPPTANTGSLVSKSLDPTPSIPLRQGTSREEVLASFP